MLFPTMCLILLPAASKQTKAPQAVTQSGQLAEALRLAWEETQSAPQKEAISQRYNFYYDIELNRPCIRVYTDYYYDGTEAMGVDFFEYDFMMDEEVRP